MKILSMAFVALVAVLGVSAIVIAGQQNGLQHAEIESCSKLDVEGIPVGNPNIDNGNVVPVEDEDCKKPIIECNDPRQTGRNMCSNGYAMSACKSVCSDQAKKKCSWNQNSVDNCEKACTVRNGCTNR